MSETRSARRSRTARARSGITLVRVPPSAARAGQKRVRGPKRRHCDALPLRNTSAKIRCRSPHQKSKGKRGVWKVAAASAEGLATRKALAQFQSSYRRCPVHSPCRLLREKAFWRVFHSNRPYRSGLTRGVGPKGETCPTRK